METNFLIDGVTGYSMLPLMRTMLKNLLQTGDRSNLDAFYAAALDAFNRNRAAASKKIATEMEDRGLSSADVCRRTGMPRSTLSRALSNYLMIPNYYLIPLCYDALRMSINDLLLDEQNVVTPIGKDKRAVYLFIRQSPEDQQMLLRWGRQARKAVEVTQQSIKSTMLYRLGELAQENSITVDRLFGSKTYNVNISLTNYLSSDSPNIDIRFIMYCALALNVSMDYLMSQDYTQKGTVVLPPEARTEPEKRLCTEFLSTFLLLDEEDAAVLYTKMLRATL